MVLVLALVALPPKRTWLPSGTARRTMPAGVGILNREPGACGAVVDEALNKSEGIVVQHDF
jgi:hypothetical protein